MPEFRRRPDSWEIGGEAKGESAAQIETDSILKWVGIGLILLLVAAAIGLTLHKGNKDRAGESAAEPTAAELVALEEEAVKQAVRDYLASGSIEDRLKLVRRAELVRGLMENYYSEIDMYPLVAWDCRVLKRSFGGIPFWSVVVNTPEGIEQLFVEQRGDEFKVDWETHVGLNPIEPVQYLRDRPPGVLDFRVYVSAVRDYYNLGSFANQEEKYLVAKLEFANSRKVVFGYIEKTSPDFTTFLDLVNSARGKPAQLVLGLEWPATEDQGAEDQHPQVHIRKLVARQWLIVD